MSSSEETLLPPMVALRITWTRLIRGSSIPSRYLRTTLPNILGWKCFVSPLSAIGLRRSFRLKALASSVFLRPAWYLWAPTQWAHPGAVPFPPQRTHKAYVQCGLRRFPHEGFRWCWFLNHLTLRPGSYPSSIEQKKNTKSFANFLTKCSCKSGLVFRT